MTVSLCIRQGSKRNDDSVSVEELMINDGDEFWAQGLHLKSHQRCSDGIRTWLSADQSSSSTLTESSFLFDPCLIHRDTVMLE